LGSSLKNHMILTIHQPEHLPWLGFFHKAAQVDLLVILDNVQYRKNYFQNRNKIRTSNGWAWLTVPVLTKGEFSQSIWQVEIDNRSGPRWKQKCWSTMQQHYSKAEYWLTHKRFFEDLYASDWTHLLNLNQAIMGYLFRCLGMDIRVIKSSDMKVVGRSSALLLNICQELGADTYLSGISGKDYLDMDSFASAGIEVRFQEFHHPVYKQMYEPFVPGLSTIDLLFNYGPDSMDMIKGIGVETMDEVFE